MGFGGRLLEPNQEAALELNEKQQGRHCQGAPTPWEEGFALPVTKPVPHKPPCLVSPSRGKWLRSTEQPPSVVGVVGSTVQKRVASPSQAQLRGTTHQ